jgi:ubiquinone/menaquinone biosynthesis C-methylase UbiE
MTFKDYFSRQASIYARNRPQYPSDLFDWLASVAPACHRAWDCATGNGQAAVGLAQHFEHVVATDPSKAQIANAFRYERIAYCVCTAEKPAIGDNCMDLITVAQALHWINTDIFFEEARRALVPGGVVAVWAYGHCTVNPQVDPIIENFHYNTVGPYWPKERQIVEDGYTTVVMPFEELKPPQFNIVLDWTTQNMLDYLRSWSPVQRYIEAHGSNPVDLIRNELTEAWGEEERRVTWPLFVRAGIKDS